MTKEDPFLKERQEYEKLRKEYDSTIVSSFDIKDFRKYNEILFSAHSCAIEGNSFTVDDTRELHEKGYAVNLVNKTLLEAFEIMDHFNAYNHIIENNHRPFDERLLKQTHEILTRNTIGFKGYVPGDYAKTQMAAGDTIFRDTRKAIENVPKLMSSFDTALKDGRTHPVELSAIFHKMFIYSHPFPDGNGRLGRLMSNFIMERNHHPHIIVTEDKRNDYIESLKASEKHNTMLPIVSFFYKTAIERMNRELLQKKNLSKNFGLGIKGSGHKDMGISY